MSAQTQIIVSAKDLATGTFRRIGLATKGLTNELFSMRNALMGGAVVGIAAMVRQSIEATDRIGKVADKVGLTTDQLQELRYAANLAGVAQNQLDMGMQRFSRRLGEVAQGQGELLKTAEQYGVELRNSDGSMRSNIDLLGEWANVIKNAESEQEALRIAFKLFDSEGAALVNMLRGGATHMDGMRHEAHELGLVIEEDLVRSSENANDQLTKMEMLVQARLRSTLAELSPDIIEVANGTFEWIKANRELLTQKVPQYVRETVQVVKEFNGVVSVSAEVGALQVGSLGYIGYRLFGSGGPGAILAGMYAAYKGAEAFNQIATPLAEQLGLLMPAPEGYDKSVESPMGFGDLMPGGRADKLYRELMRRVGGAISGKAHFLSGGITDDYKAVLEAAKQGSVPKSLLMARPPEVSVDPRDREYSGAYPHPWHEPPAPAPSMSDKQLKLQEDLTREIQRLTLDQYAFARAEAERTYQSDLALADKNEALIAQAGERRRLSLASIAEEEAKFNQKQVADAAQAQRDLNAEIERATLGRFEAQRRESDRYYDDLIRRAEEAGQETVALEEAKVAAIDEINQQETDERARQRQEESREAKRFADDMHDIHLTMLSSSNNVVDGLELGMLRWQESNKSVAEVVADGWTQTFDTVGTMGANMALGMQDDILDVERMIRRLAAEIANAQFIQPAMSGLSSMIGSALGLSSSSTGAGAEVKVEAEEYAYGGVSVGKQLAWVSEGPYDTEAHVPLPDGRTIPVSLSGSMMGGVQSMPTLEVRVINQSGQPMTMQNGGTTFDGERYVCSMVMRGIRNNTEGIQTFFKAGGA